jgi:hypothetical protein
VGVDILRDDLLSLPGIEQAEIDGDSTAPAGVRVRLAPGVDPVTIGDEIRRVLAMHGLHQETAGSPEPPEADTIPSSETEKVETVAPEDRVREPEVSVAGVEADKTFDSVGVAEGRDGIIVTAVSSIDDVEVRAAGSSEAAIDQAVVLAVAELAGAASVPLICSIDDRDLAGTPVVTVVVEEDGRRLVGSAVMDGGRAYALGRAVWAALSAS